MDSLRSLAISLEEEDRADLGGYIAVVLQKLANMNELFLGERVRRNGHIAYGVAPLPFRTLGLLQVAISAIPPPDLLWLSSVRSAFV